MKKTLLGSSFTLIPYHFPYHTTFLLLFHKILSSEIPLTTFKNNEKQSTEHQISTFPVCLDNSLSTKSLGFKFNLLNQESANKVLRSL